MKLTNELIKELTNHYTPKGRIRWINTEIKHLKAHLIQLEAAYKNNTYYLGDKITYNHCVKCRIDLSKLMNFKNNI